MRTIFLRNLEYAHAETKCFYLLYFPGVKVSYEFEFVTKQTPVFGIRPVETIDKRFIIVWKCGQEGHTVTTHSNMLFVKINVESLHWD